jgi:hypothetical protein
VPSERESLEAAERVRSAQLYVAGKNVTPGGVSVTNGKPAASCGGTLFAQENILETASAVPRAMGAGRGGS